LAQISRAVAVPAGASAPPAPPLDLRSDDPDELLALVSLARVVTADSSFRDVLSLITGQLRRLLPRGTSALYLLDHGGEDLALEHAAGVLAPSLAGMTIRVGQKLTGWVAAHRRTIVNSDAALDLADAVVDGRYTCLSAPLLEGDTLVGVLTIYADASEPFTDEQGRMVQMVAPHLASMIATCRAEAIAVSVPAAPARPAHPSSTSGLRIVAAAG
jgi:signal transduction protein with GAF and PtsI domain